MLMIFSRRSLSGNLSTTLIISGVLLAIGITFFLFIMPRILSPSTDLWLGDGVFKAKVALDENARTKGLSGLNQLGEEEALIMAYPTDDKWGIWMKDMSFPIDIVWLDRDKRVVSIVKNASPEDSTSVTHQPKDPSRYVIELPAGTVDRKSITVSKTAVFQVNEKEVK